MQIRELPHTQIPMSLLLEADPSTTNIHSYLSESICFAAIIDAKVIAVCAICCRDNRDYELLNIAVEATYQRQGIGRKLLIHVLTTLTEQGASKVSVCTGTFGYQLAFYQREGFRVSAVVKNHFLKNYDEPIFEQGIQHKDMLMLELNLPKPFI